MSVRTTHDTSMHRQRGADFRALILTVALLGFVLPPVWGQISIPSLETPYTQNFDTLANSGTSSVVPAGWAFLETGTNANTTYTAGTGSSTAGDTYSFGASGSSERAFGGLLSGNLNPTIGASFTNNTGFTITNLIVSYTGEEWRLGAAGRTDRLDFQYSLNATGLNNGTWTDVDTLDFITPNTTAPTGAKDGNLAANRTAITHKITGLNIANGATFWIRWSDYNPSGSDDGLAVDDFSLTASQMANLSINDVSLPEGNSGTTTFTFTVSLTSPAPTGGVTFDLATADGTATVADNDYVADSVTGATIPEGSSSYSFDVVVLGDTALEADEIFYVNVSNVTGADAADSQGAGTILDDDAARLTIGDVTVTEGDSGTTTAQFIVSLNRPAFAGGVTFDIATADGTATVADGDYQPVNLTGVNIPEGDTQYVLDVLVNGDTTDEPNEAFTVNVTNLSGTGVVLLDGTATGAITNDDMPYTPIHDIQGSGSTSPLAGTVVTTRGIVTAVKYNGYFIQSREALYDADPNTSEGLQVFTSSAPPALARVGSDVVVTGTVSEYIPAADPGSPPLTELTGSTIAVVLYTGQPVPAPVVLTAADTDPAGSIEQLEKYEGMLVAVPSLTVISPSMGNVNEPGATATPNGTFYGVITGFDRPFREAGIEAPDPIPTPPCCIPRFDGNPERLRVDTDAIDDLPSANVTTGVTMSNLVGPLDYGYRTYTILTFAGWTASPNAAPVPVTPPLETEATIATWNMLRFFDTVNDPATDDPVLTSTAFNNRLAKASLVIRTMLRMPDIIGVQEIENISVLQAVAAQVNTDAVAAGGTDPQYAAYLEEGNDVGGIDVGLLVRGDRVTVNSVVQYGKDTVFPYDGSLLNDRPPLVLDAAVNLPGLNPFPVVVVVNHLRSMSSIDDPTDGPRVRAKRQAQAEYLASLIQTFQSANPDGFVASVGDYNAFIVNDGYVDVIGTVIGAPTPADEVLIQVSNDLVNPDLVNLYSTLPPDEVYSYTYDGNAQTLDYILVNQNLAARLDWMEVARVNADFPKVYYGDPARPESFSDHDPLVAAFTWACEVTCSAEAAPSIGLAPLTVNFTSTVEPVNCLNPVEYWWDFGDGETSAEANPVHTYVGGTWTWTLTVTSGTTECTTTGTVIVDPFDLSFYDDLGRARLCVNSVTGAFEWTLLTGPYKGVRVAGTAMLSEEPGLLTLSSPPWATGWQMLFRYYTQQHRGAGTLYLRGRQLTSALSDHVTTNNPAGCD